MHTELAAWSTFLDDVRGVEGLAVDVRGHLEGVDAQALDEFETRTGRRFGDAVRALYAAGFTHDFRIYELGRAFDFVVLEFLPVVGSSPGSGMTMETSFEGWAFEAEEVAMLLEEQGDDPGLRLRRDQMLRGIPLWEDENSLIVDGETGAISRISGEVFGSDPIADDLPTFLRHFLAAGCFQYGGADGSHFAAYWEKVRGVVPFGIAPAENLWLRHLDRWYSGTLHEVFTSLD